MTGAFQDCMCEPVLCKFAYEILKRFIVLAKTFPKGTVFVFQIERAKKLNNLFALCLPACLSAFLPVFCLSVCKHTCHSVCISSLMPHPHGHVSVCLLYGNATYRTVVYNQCMCWCLTGSVSVLLGWCVYVYVCVCGGGGGECVLVVGSMCGVCVDVQLASMCGCWRGGGGNENVTIDWCFLSWKLLLIQYIEVYYMWTVITDIYAGPFCHWCSWPIYVWYLIVYRCWYQMSPKPIYLFWCWNFYCRNE